MTGAYSIVDEESRSSRRDRAQAAAIAAAPPTVPDVSSAFEITAGSGVPTVRLDDIEPAPPTERVSRPSTRISATMSIAPSISLDTAGPATHEQMTELLAALGVSHTKLDLSLAYVEKLASAVFDRNAMCRAAGDTVMLRALEVAELRDALGRVVIAVDEPNAALLLAPGTTLSSYVKMIYMWSGQVTDALIAFASSAMTGEPAWADYDTRMAETAQFQMQALTEQIRHEAGAYGIFSEFGESLDELFWAVWYLHRSITKAGEAGEI